MALSLRTTEKVSSLTEDDELRKRGYIVGSTLGEGSYAKVKSAFSEKLQKKVALKIISRRKAPKDFQEKFLPRELHILRQLRHPHVVQLYEVMQFGGKVFIAMEIAGHGDLLEYIKLRGAIAEEKAKHMFYQLVSAVEYLHTHDIIHRDLKCENILLDTHNNVKISDFGFARIQTPDDLSKTFCGSAAYAAPEILQGIPYYGPYYDIWSLGVILYIMVCGSMPYDDSNIKKMIKYQTERKVGFSRSKNVSSDCKELIHMMLEANIKKRASIKEVLESKWLAETTIAHRGVEKVGTAVDDESTAKRTSSKQKEASIADAMCRSSRNRIREPMEVDETAAATTAPDAAAAAAKTKEAEGPIAGLINSFRPFKAERGKG